MKKLLNTLSLITMLSVSTFVIVNNKYMLNKKTFNNNLSNTLNEINLNKQNVKAIKPTKFRGIDGQEHYTDLIDLSHFTDKDFIVLEIGYYRDEFGENRAVRLPKDVVDVPNKIPSEITSTRSMFEDAYRFNHENIKNWDTSNVKDMTNMFKNAAWFNRDISDWDVSNVEQMDDFLNGAIDFNQDLSRWNLKKLENNFNSNWSLNTHIANDVKKWPISVLKKWTLSRNEILDSTYKVWYKIREHLNHETKIKNVFSLFRDNFKEVHKHRTVEFKILNNLNEEDFIKNSQNLKLKINKTIVELPTKDLFNKKASKIIRKFDRSEVEVNDENIQDYINKISSNASKDLREKHDQENSEARARGEKPNLERQHKEKIELEKNLYLKKLKKLDILVVTYLNIMMVSVNEWN